MSIYNKFIRIDTETGGMIIPAANITSIEYNFTKILIYFTKDFKESKWEISTISERGVIDCEKLVNDICKFLNSKKKITIYKYITIRKPEMKFKFYKFMSILWIISIITWVLLISTQAFFFNKNKENTTATNCVSDLKQQQR